MKALCFIRRHKWRLETDGGDQYEKCLRCGHYRNDGSWRDVMGGGNMGRPSGLGHPGGGAGGADAGPGGGDAGM
jgi:hypothetical protein